MEPWARKKYRNTASQYPRDGPTANADSEFELYPKGELGEEACC